MPYFIAKNDMRVSLYQREREREARGFLIDGVEPKSSPLEKNLTKELEAYSLPGDGMGVWEPPTREWSNQSRVGM